MAIGDAGNLQCKKLYHVVLESFGSSRQGAKTEVIVILYPRLKNGRIVLDTLVSVRLYVNPSANFFSFSDNYYSLHLIEPKLSI